MRINQPALAPSVIILTLLLSNSKALSAKPVERQHDEVARIYATITWQYPPSSPLLANLGTDHYLLATSTGVQLWDARNNILHEAKGWPKHSTPRRGGWIKLGTSGSLVVSNTSDGDVFRQSNLLWWNPESRDFSAPLPLPHDMFVSELVSINGNHALVCMKSADSINSSQPTESGRITARIVSFYNGNLNWETTDSNLLSPAILAADVRGPVENLGNMEDALASLPPPIIFNTHTCNWEIRDAPDDMKKDPEMYFNHYRLPDGRTLISHASWYSHARGHRATLAAPLLWNGATWESINNTAEEGGGPGLFYSYGIDTQVVSMSDSSSKFIEFLEPKNLHWIRSKQKLPEFYGIPQVAPMSTGQALFFHPNGRIYLLDPMIQGVPGHFVYHHNRVGEIKLRSRKLMLMGGGDAWNPSNRPEIVNPPSLLSKPIAPLPRQLGYTSGVELRDRTVLAFGGLPPRCGPSTDGDDCGAKPAQFSYRYFPKEDRWEQVPGLAVHFARDSSFSNGVSEYPRNDARLRRNGDFVYLDNGNHLKAKDSSQPLHTALIRWRPGATPETLARLRQGRTDASLLEMAGTKLVVIGGQTQHSKADLDQSCSDCSGETGFAGEMKPARSTEIFNEKTRKWVSGPHPNYPGGRAVKLANGRIFKLSKGDSGSGRRFQAEVANTAFNRWKKLPAFPVKSYEAMDMVVVGNRVLILPEKPYRRTVIWNDAKHRWSVSKIRASQEMLAFTPINTKLAVARTYGTFEIVPIPR